MSIFKFVCIDSRSKNNFIEVDLEEQETKKVFKVALTVRAKEETRKAVGMAAFHAMAKFAGIAPITATVLGRDFLASMNHLKGWEVRGRVYGGEIASFLPFKSDDSFTPYGSDSPDVEAGQDVWLSVEKAEPFGIKPKAAPSGDDDGLGDINLSNIGEQKRDENGEVVETDYGSNEPHNRKYEWGPGAFQYPAKARCVQRYRDQRKANGGKLTDLQVFTLTKIIVAMRTTGKDFTLARIAAVTGANSAQCVSGFVSFMISGDALERKGDDTFKEGSRAESVITSHIDDSQVGKAIAKLWGEASHV